MKQKILAALCGLLLLPATLGAQEAKHEARLNAVYEKLLKRSGVRADSVRYTGSDFAKAGHGFIWQRGDGKGWTVGRRLSLKGVGQKEADQLYATFAQIGEHQFADLKQENRAATFMEETRTVFAYEYTPADSTLYFLKAVAENEVSVPGSWKTADVVDATHHHPAVHDPLADITQQQARRLGLARLWAGVLRNFAFMDRVKISWDSAYVAAMEEVATAADDEAYGRILQRMAALLGDGHTYVYYNADTRCPQPFTTRLVDGRVYIDKVYNRALGRQGIRRGAELTAVNGRPIREYAEQNLYPYISSSTPQWTLHEAYDGFGLLRVRRGERLELTLNDGGKDYTVGFSSGEYAADEPVQDPSLSLEMKKGGIAYLRIRSFSGSNFERTFDALYEQLKDTKGLVIDVRDNPGGNSGLASYVLGHLTADSITLGGWESPLYVPALFSWGHRDMKHRVPAVKMAPQRRKPVYTQPVAVLIDRGTFSAAEDFTATFQGMKRGLTFGSPSGGSTGNGVQVALVSGAVYANICSKHDTAPDGTEFVGVGIRPDRPVEETVQTCFRDKEDAALTAALKSLRSGE